jgi:hypothetical protein
MLVPLGVLLLFLSQQVYLGSHYEYARRLLPKHGEPVCFFFFRSVIHAPKTKKEKRFEDMATYQEFVKKTQYRSAMLRNNSQNMHYALEKGQTCLLARSFATRDTVPYPSVRIKACSIFSEMIRNSWVRSVTSRSMMRGRWCSSFSPE